MTIGRNRRIESRDRARSSSSSFCRVLMTIVTMQMVLLAGSSDARSWDIAVTIGREIDFLSNNGTLLGQTLISEAQNLIGLAYDDISHTMFLSDQNSNYSVFSIDLADKNITLRPLLKKRPSSPIVGLVYDHKTQTLFWAEEQVLMKMQVPRKGKPGPPVVLHDLKDQSLRGIALDTCNRRIYWVNSNRTNPSIERSDLEGRNRKVIINHNLYEPSNLIIDHRARKLYWIDDEEGIHYKLERSNLDASGREIVVHGTHQQPVSLAIDDNNIYWTDLVYSAIWTIGKDVKPGDVPKSFKSFFSNRQADPRNLITRNNNGINVDCFAIARGTLPPGLPPVPPTQESFNNLTTSTEVEAVDLRDSPIERCFNNGIYSGKNNSCQCKPGFGGSKCEITSCHNYCLRGKCVVNSDGEPTCECGEAFSGTRCENDVCNGYCLNDGQCSVNNGKPVCDCKYTSGSRCENSLDMGEICSLFCSSRHVQLNSIDTSSCSCAELSNNTIEEILNYDNLNCTILVPLLSGVIGMLTIVVIALSIYINKLRRRPRIKKRFVVNKSGITPLTSRPQMSSDQCEITIENCCNMNICETPCFEPNLRTTTSKKTKKEEKSGLLDDMEGNFC